MKNSTVVGFLGIVLVFSGQFVTIYGESFEAAVDKTGIFVLVQIEIRDKDGQLVAYLEPRYISITNMNKLNEQLDKGGEAIQKSNITVGEKNYEMIKGVGFVVHNADTVVSQTIISAIEQGLPSILVVANHDGYPVTEGDRVTSTWIIIRSAD